MAAIHRNHRAGPPGGCLCREKQESAIQIVRGAEVSQRNALDRLAAVGLIPKLMGELRVDVAGLERTARRTKSRTNMGMWSSLLSA